ncbi:MAG: hypothetical protein HYS27_22270 [Deltaproteobacteria bacterium]|nr:hypothetical protein [Deltaproteobacteria bacterium]
MSAALALLAMVLAVPPAPAGSPEPSLAGVNVVLLVDKESGRGAPAVGEARAALVASGAAVVVRTVAEAARTWADADDAVWLALGKVAAKALANAPPRSRAALLVRAGEAGGLPAVVVDVPFERQLAWLAAAFPGRTRVLVPRRPGNAADAALRAAAATSGLTVELVDVHQPGETVPALQAALRRPGAPALILLVPDATALTPDTLAPLAQSALEARAPLIGFSSYFLRIGALAASIAEVGPSARQAVAAAKAGVVVEEAPRAAHLLVDGRLAERLGVPVREGPGVEVRR